ncbi:MAG: DUF4396 domain-containing protein [Pelomonas sp.]|nr:DUF4396 domain-containing protein [Roseateles sp.]
MNVPQHTAEHSHTADAQACDRPKTHGDLLVPAAAPAGAHAHHGHHAHHAGAGHAPTHAQLTTSATLHCLTGCAIGEWVGLAIGVSLGLNPWATMALATALGFASGYTLGLWPLVKQGMTWGQAFKAIWLGETVSIAVMEFAMNFTDYHVGGVQASSVLSWPFWAGYLAALPAGFLAAWPINWWLLRNEVKKPCHQG